MTRIAALYGDGNPSGVETPVPAYPGGEKLSGQTARSRTDPNGVFYYPIQRFGLTGIVAVRPHPLPPSWLALDSTGTAPPVWDGTLAPGESRAVPLTFSAGTRAPGLYTVALQAFDAATERVVEVPLALTVMQGTDAEDDVTEPAGASLAVYPNPLGGVSGAAEATVALTLDRAGEVRLVIYDVLGRAVAVLADGEVAAGEHAFDLDASRLPAGLYLVRFEVSGRRLTQPLSIVR